jgi:hypothetical protein
MAASERKRRSIVEGCKYRPIARLVQHREATVTISGAIQKGALDQQALKAKADFIAISWPMTTSMHSPMR